MGILVIILGFKQNISKNQEENDYFNSFNETRLFNFSTLKDTINDQRSSSNWGKKLLLKNKIHFNVSSRRQRDKTQKDYFSLDNSHSNLTQDIFDPLTSPLLKNFDQNVFKSRIKHRIKVKCPISRSIIKGESSKNLRNSYNNESAESPFHHKVGENRNVIVKEDSDYNDINSKLTSSFGKDIFT